MGVKMAFKRWMLKALPAENHPPIYVSQCTRCHEESEGSDSKEAPELWALNHAARRDKEGDHHKVFRTMVIAFAEAFIFEEDAEGTDLVGYVRT